MDLNDPIYQTYSLRSTHWYVSLLHFKTFTIQFHGPPLCVMLWSVKYTFTCQRCHFQDCEHYFFNIKFAKFLYEICFVPNLIWTLSSKNRNEGDSFTQNSCLCFVLKKQTRAPMKKHSSYSIILKILYEKNICCKNININ